MTLVERAFARGELRRPTDFVNGCGPRESFWLSRVLVPDELVGVEFGVECCNPHDLAYYMGGFWGLFWRKPKADFGLGACVMSRFMDAAAVRWMRDSVSGKALAVGTAMTGAAVSTAFTTAVLLLGWTPLTWSWRKNPAPTEEELRKVADALRCPRSRIIRGRASD